MEIVVDHGTCNVHAVSSLSWFGAGRGVVMLWTRNEGNIRAGVEIFEIFLFLENLGRIDDFIWFGR